MLMLPPSSLHCYLLFRFCLEGSCVFIRQLPTHTEHSSTVSTNCYFYWRDFKNFFLIPYYHIIFSFSPLQPAITTPSPFKVFKFLKFCEVLTTCSALEVALSRKNICHRCFYFSVLAGLILNVRLMDICNNLVFLFL